MTYVASRQFVNADATHIHRRLGRRSHRTSRRSSFYNSTNTVTSRAIPTVQTTNLPGNWQYSRCLAYVYQILVHARDLLTLILASRASIMSSRIRSHSLKTTLPKTVLHNAQPLVIPRPAWKMATSAVCGLLLWSDYDVAYGNTTH